MQKAEQFLRTARLTNTFAGGAFDFISVCPPYLLVDYNELFDLLEASPLVRPRPKPDDYYHAVQCHVSHDQFGEESERVTAYVHHKRHQFSTPAQGMVDHMISSRKGGVSDCPYTLTFYKHRTQIKSDINPACINLQSKSWDPHIGIIICISTYSEQ